MDTSSERTFYTRASRGYGVALGLFAAIWVVIGIATIVSSVAGSRDTSWALAVFVGIPATAFGALLLRLAVRMLRVRLTAGPEGVTVVGARRDHRFTWDEIRAVRARPEPSFRPWATDAARVVLDLAGGRSFVVSALRFEGGWARTATSKRMAEAKAVCAEIERLRPDGVPGPGQPAARADKPRAHSM
jgi:Bacterial PH domain